MSEQTQDILVTIGCIIGLVIAVYCVNHVEKHGTVKYDCTMVEIQRDMPEKVRNECRRLMAKKNWV
jgi:hypothetical protein